MRETWSLERLAQFSVVCLLILATVYSLYVARTVLLPFVLAMLLAVILHPAVRVMARARIPPGVGAVAVVLSVLFSISALFNAIAPPAEEWFNRLPTFVRQIEFKLSDLRDSIDVARDVTDELASLAEPDDAVPTVVVEEPGIDQAIAADVQYVVLSAGLTMLLLSFMLACGPRLVDGIAGGIANSERRASFRNGLKSIAIIVGHYYQTVTVINVALGLATWGVMTLLGMPEPALWGVLAAVMNFMPYVGPLITTSVIGIVSLLSFHTWADIILPPAIYFALNALEGQVITPIVVGRRLTLNPLLVLASILFWGWMWGLAGALLAVPILAALKVVCGEVQALRPWQSAFG